MEKKNQSKESEEITIDYAYGVINAITESMDKVSANQVNTRAFLFSIQQKYPEIFDALMAVTVPEHREIVGKVIQACARMTALWLKTGKM